MENTVNTHTKKEKLLDLYYLPFLNKPLNEIVDYMNEKYPDYTDFRFNVVVNLTQMSLQIYGNKK